MVNEMLANIWTVDNGRDLERGEVCGRTNSRQHEELWSTEDTAGKDEFLGGVPRIEGCYQSISASGTVRMNFNQTNHPWKLRIVLHGMKVYHAQCLSG